MFNICQRLSISELWNKDHYQKGMRRSTRNIASPVDFLPRDCCPSRNRHVDCVYYNGNFYHGLFCGILISIIVILLLVILSNIDNVAYMKKSTYFENQQPKSEPQFNTLKEMQNEIDQLTEKVKALSQETSHYRETMKDDSDPGPTMKEECELPNIDQLISQAISVYDTDKIGLYDYAAAYAGGTIISTPTTFFHPTNNTYSMFGFFELYVMSKPEIMLDTNTLPGECFAFSGNEAKIIIKLGQKITITDVTLEQGSLSSLTDQSSAPKDFKVLGLEDSTGYESEELGEFQYQIDKGPIQTFHIKEEKTKTYEYILLQISSNYGNPDFTCIYRFRVHSTV